MQKRLKHVPVHPDSDVALTPCVRACRRTCHRAHSVEAACASAAQTAFCEHAGPLRDGSRHGPLPLVTPPNDPASAHGAPRSSPLCHFWVVVYAPQPTQSIEAEVHAHFALKGNNEPPQGQRARLLWAGADVNPSTGIKNPTAWIGPHYPSGHKPE